MANQRPDFSCSRSSPRPVRSVGRSLGWDRGVGVVGGPEGEGAADPLLQRVVELLVVALLIGGGGDPPADVDVVAQDVGGEWGASSQRGQIGASQVSPAGVVDRVGERTAVAEFTLVPDQVYVVVAGCHRPGGPRAAAGASDDLDAGIDPADVLVEICAADRMRADVVVAQLGGRGVTVG